jgi:hypothetical protein
MRLATASGRRSQQPPDQTSAYRCGRSRLRRLGQPDQPSPMPEFLTASVRNGSRTQATIRSALRPSLPFRSGFELPESCRSRANRGETGDLMRPGPNLLMSCHLSQQAPEPVLKIHEC